MNLMKASNQWANRPDDQRYATLEDLHRACRGLEARQSTRPVDLRKLEIETIGHEGQDDDLVLRGSSGQLARLSHWAFGQLASMAGAPAAYLRTLPAMIVAQCLRLGLRNRDNADEVSGLFMLAGERMLRSLNGGKYARIWDSEMAERLIGYEQRGWQVPPGRPCREDQAGTRPATEADLLRGNRHGLSIGLGDPIAPAGIYKSDSDLFVFMVDETRPVELPGRAAPLYRGFFMQNSEVGKYSYSMDLFLYDAVCGNHIVWDATKLGRVAVRHVGKGARDRAARETEALTSFTNDSQSGLVATIARAHTTILGEDREQVIEALWARQVAGLTRALLGQAYDIASSDRGLDRYGGNPNTLWAMVSGLTEASQESTHADARTAVDRAAGKLLGLVA